MNKRLIFTCSIALLALAALACGLPGGLPGAEQTVGAAATGVSEQLPTLEAQFTQFASELTRNAPALDATATVVEATLQALGSEVGQGELLTAVAGTLAPPTTVSGGGGGTGLPTPTLSAPGGGPTIFDGGDGYDTTLVNTISIGQTASGEITATFEAHNWLFEGVGGQVVTIRVESQGEADPFVKLINPDGVVIAQNDDYGGTFNALITVTLPLSGTYTIRVTAWSPGAYTISLEQ